jgi:hypothetical protein
MKEKGKKLMKIASAKYFKNFPQNRNRQTDK